MSSRSSLEPGAIEVELALAAPTGEVGDEHVLAEVQLGLVEEDPAAGVLAPRIAIEGSELNPEPRRRATVTPGRARADDELAIDQLAVEPSGRARMSS